MAVEDRRDVQCNHEFQIIETHPDGSKTLACKKPGCGYSKKINPPQEAHKTAQGDKKLLME